MILSMTGYGKATVTFADKKIHAEIRTLNSKTLDLLLRVPHLYHEREMEMRRLLTPLLVRGKAEVSVWTEDAPAKTAAHLNAAAIAAYSAQLQDVSTQCGLPYPTNPWNIIIRLPDTFTAQAEEELSAEEWDAVCQALRQAAARLEEFRRQEGEALQHKFEEKLSNIASLMQAIEPYEQQRTEKIRQRLEERLAEIKGVDYDRGRLEQELIFYIEKLDISEEKQRLANHLAYFRTTMAEGEGQGKKLGFIAQEMGREINTTGSKSNQAEMQNLVVRMKDELEQIKEQVLNVL
ncbi:MAG: YicC family protein [Bacteroidaceae bacterium]|nr:YicC family protein [Bacteroidaceae bacterium]